MGWEVRLPSKKATVAPGVKMLGMRDVRTTVSLNRWHLSAELFPVALDVGLFAGFVQGTRMCGWFVGFLLFSFFPFFLLLSFVLPLPSLLSFVC